jgi:hypothetical protein
LQGTSAAERCEIAVAARFPGYVVLVGQYNRRLIAGSSTWSQHAFANADDFHLSIGRSANAEEKAKGDEIAAWLRANALALGIRTVLWWVKDHFDHIHVDYWPMGIGTPPLSSTGVASFRYSDGRTVSQRIQLVPPEGEGVEEDMELTEENYKKIGEAVLFKTFSDPVSGGVRGIAHHIVQGYKQATDAAIAARDAANVARQAATQATVAATQATAAAGNTTKAKLIAAVVAAGVTGAAVGPSAADIVAEIAKRLGGG